MKVPCQFDVVQSVGIFVEPNAKKAMENASQFVHQKGLQINHSVDGNVHRLSLRNKHGWHMYNAEGGMRRAIESKGNTLSDAFLALMRKLSGLKIETSKVFDIPARQHQSCTFPKLDIPA